MRAMQASIFNSRLFCILCLCFCGFVANAQENEEGTKENIRRFVTYQIALVKPLAFGDNFAKDGLDQVVGYDLSLRFYVFESIYAGVEGGSFTAEVDKEELVGDYDQSNANTYGISAGYTFELNESNLIDTGLSYGHINYRNRKEGLDDRFVDSGSYLKINAQYNYRFSKNVSLFAFTNIRFDYLDIETSPLIDNFINRANYMIFGIGFKASIFTDISELW